MVVHLEIGAHGIDHPPERNVLQNLVPVATTKNTANTIPHRVGE